MTNHRLRFESLSEPLDDEERMLMDPDTWDWENVEEGGPSPDPHLIFHVRLSGDDIETIEQAAIARQMNVGAYLRYAGLQCALQKAPK